MCCRLILVFLATCSLTLAVNSKTNNSVFVPTKEWQVVPKGVPVPQSLHIRHNLQTGLTEAKLLNENEKDEKKNSGNEKQALTLHPNESVEDEEEEQTFKKSKKDGPDEKIKLPLDELKTMLKKIKADEADELIQTANEQVHSAVQKEYRSYSELKQQLEILNLNISTDAEVLSSLFEQFEPYKNIITSENLETKKVEDILDILNDMEYLLHQIDNARLFADLGGMTKIISPSLNSTNSDIKTEALKLLGTTVQSNPRVQLKALESDFVKKILYMLTINNKVAIKSRCLFALGALIRHFPEAQKNFINNGGLEILGKILIDGSSQVQIRVMNLINDLTIERENLKEIQDEQQRLRRTKEYDSMDFENKLVNQKYCENLVDLSVRSLRIKTGIDDFHEVIYESMMTLNQICKNQFVRRKDDLIHEIEKMLIIYRDYPVIGEDGENLSSNNQKMLQKILNILFGRKIHEEL